MGEEAIMSIVSISVIAGTVAFCILLMTIRSIVRTNVLATLKTRCIAAGMSPEEIERVVMVGEKKCAARATNVVADEYGYPVEKAPPVVANRGYAAAR